MGGRACLAPFVQFQGKRAVENQSERILGLGPIFLRECAERAGLERDSKIEIALVALFKDGDARADEVRIAIIDGRLESPERHGDILCDLHAMYLCRTPETPRRMVLLEVLDHYDYFFDDSLLRSAFIKQLPPAASVVEWKLLPDHAAIERHRLEAMANRERDRRLRWIAWALLAALAAALAFKLKG